MQHIILKDIYDTPDLSRNTTALGVYNSKRTIDKVHKHIHTSPNPTPHPHKKYIYKNTEHTVKSSFWDEGAKGSCALALF